MGPNMNDFLHANFNAVSELSYFLVMALVQSPIKSPPSMSANDDAGPEVVDEAVKVLELISEKSSDFKLKLESHQFGGCAIDAVGEPLPATTLKACQEADAILMGMSFT